MTIAHLNHQHLRNRYLCITHFDDKYIQNKDGKRKRLSNKAVPHKYNDEQFVTPHSPRPSTSQGICWDNHIVSTLINGNYLF